MTPLVVQAPAPRPGHPIDPKLALRAIVRCAANGQFREVRSGCIEWAGATDRQGYAYIRIAPGSRRAAHRVAWVAWSGEDIPFGMVIDHLCRNPRCCNPEHLEAVTHRENTLRGTAPSAQLADVTECPKGHPYSDDNLVHNSAKSGHRKCRQCHLEASRIQNAALREAASALGLTRNEYTRRYGFSKYTAWQVIARNPIGE